MNDLWQEYSQFIGILIAVTFVNTLGIGLGVLAAVFQGGF